MNKITVKQEHKVDVMQCQACLSVDRNLSQLGSFRELYKMLTSDFINSTNIYLNSVRICWECIALLRKVEEFQTRVKKAKVLLQLGQGHLVKLSTLTTINIFEGTYTECTKNNAALSQTDTGIKTADEGVSGHLDLINTDSTMEASEEGVQERHIADVKRRKSDNRWARKRALQNRRPKFRTIPTDEHIYRRVKIDCNELNTCVRAKTENECHKSKRCKCEELFIGRSINRLLRKHMTKHRGELGREFICDICSAKFANKKSLSNHIMFHYYIFECVLCGFSCRTQDQKRDHLRQHRRILQCLKCKLQFCNRREFFRHHKEWHEVFVCDHCGVSFKMRYCIKEHLRKQHSSFQCKLCDKNFGRYNGLWLHNKLRHSPRGQPAYCVECDKHYADVYRYRWHLANSARHKPRQKVRVPCPDCEKVFSKNIYMKDHYNLVHLKNFKYRCEECNKNFIRNADLVKHRRRVHEGILPAKNKICYVCGRGFTTNKILTNHLRTHTGERPYECDACPARFAQRTALTSHLRAVHRKLRDSL